MIAVAEIIEEVLLLSQTDRSYIAKKLIESLDIEESFTAEELKTFNRRSRETRDSTVEPLSLEQLQRSVSVQLA